MSYLATADPGVLRKVVLEAGEVDGRPPSRWDQVKINFRLETGDGTLIDEQLDPEKPLECKVGDQDLMKGMNLGLTTMVPGERAEFTIPGDLTYDLPEHMAGVAADKEAPANCVKAVVKLLEVKRGVPVGKWDLEDEEKLGFAEQIKAEGNALFKAQDWPGAQAKYAQAIEIVEWDKSPRRMDLKISCLYNITLAMSRQKHFVSALERVNWAINLRPQEAKGYFRRGTLYLAMGEFERAEEELMRALDIEPGNIEVQGQLAKVKETITKYHAESAGMYGKMFAKGVYEPKQTSAYSDSLNPVIQLNLTRGEDLICLRVELFNNLLPDTVNYVESLVQARALEGYLAAEVKADNYILFRAAEPEAEYFQSRTFENKSTKIKEAGYVFFVTGEDGKYSSEIGISLAPLPWFDGKWVPFGFVSVPVDFAKRVKELLMKGDAEVENDKSQQPLCLRNVAMF